MRFLSGLGDLDHVPAAVIVGTDFQGDDLVIGGLGLGIRDQGLQGWRKSPRVPQHPQAHADGVHVANFLFQVNSKQAREELRKFLASYKLKSHLYKTLRTLINSTLGNSSTNSLMVTPSSKFSTKDTTGTRVPLNTHATLTSSGLSSTEGQVFQSIMDKC